MQLNIRYFYYPAAATKEFTERDSMHAHTADRELYTHFTCPIQKSKII